MSRLIVTGTVLGLSGTGTCVYQSTTLTLATVSAGALLVGATIDGALAEDFPADTTVVSQLTGTPGGVGTYEMSAEATATEVNPTAITTSAVTIETDATSLGTIGTTVTLIGPYERPPLGQWPPGWPPALSYAGSETLDIPGYTFPSGATVMFVASEAAALIAAGAAEAA